MNKTKAQMLTEAKEHLRDNGTEITDKFDQWGERKAISLHRRDRERSEKQNVNHRFAYTPKDYLAAICEAITNSNSRDYYTGEELDWSLIGTFDNEDARQGGKEYKQKFAPMPTIDHKNAEPKPEFAICSWRTNDAKNDLLLTDFIKLCEKLLIHHGYEVKKP